MPSGRVDTKKKWHFKVVVVGDSGVGKTCLCSRLIGKGFSSSSAPTIGAVFQRTSVKINGTTVDLDVWDTAGQERYRAIAPLYYRGAQGAFVVYDCTSHQSFDDAKDWIQELRRYAEPDIVIVLVGNKCDLVTPDTEGVPTLEVERYCRETGIMSLRVSALTNHGIDEAIKILIAGQEVESSPATPFPRFSEGAPPVLLPQDCETSSALSLKDMEVQVTVVDYAVDVTVQLKYRNLQDIPVEPRFSFLLPENAACYKFETIINGERVIATVRHDNNTEADNPNTPIVTQLKGNILQAVYGPIASKSTVNITFHYVTELQIEDSFLRFVFPTANIIGTLENVKVEEANLETAEQSFRIFASINVSGTIISLSSPTHFAELQYEIADQRATAFVKDNIFRGDLKRKNFEMLINTTQLASALVEFDEENNSAAVMLYLNPFQPPCSFSKVSSRDNFQNIPLDVVVLVDRSNIMSGTNWAQSQSALQLMLRSLPIGCYFNIVSFGYQYEAVFDESVKYDDESMKKASSAITSWKADLGGVSLDYVLNFVLAKEKPNRKILLVLNGLASSIDSVTKSLESEATTQVFAVGLRTEVRDIVTGIAQAGRGSFEMLGENERIELKLMKQLKRAMGLEFTSEAINWEKLTTSISEIRQVPSHLKDTKPSIFKGEKLQIYALIHNYDQDNTRNFAIDLSGSFSDSKPWRSQIKVAPPSPSSSNLVFHRLAARSAIKELESAPQESSKKEEAIKISVKYNIPCKYTTYAFSKSISNITSKAIDQKLISLAWRALIPGIPAQPQIRPWKTKFFGRGLINFTANNAYLSNLIPPLSNPVELKPKLDQAAARTCCGGGSTVVMQGVDGLETQEQLSPRQANVSISSAHEEEMKSLHFTEVASSRPPIRNSFEKLVQLANANGSWSFEQIAEFLGVSTPRLLKHLEHVKGLYQLLFPNQESIENAANEEDGDPKIQHADSSLINEEKKQRVLDVWATSLAIEFLEMYLSRERGEWDLLASKAKSWLSSSLEELMKEKKKEERLSTRVLRQQTLLEAKQTLTQLANEMKF